MKHRGIGHKTRFSELAILLAAGVTLLLLYSPALDCGFVLDDKNNIEHNPYIRITNLGADSLAGAAFRSVLPTRPVANISFALNYLAHGYSLQGFRLTNILLHIATGIILYFFLGAFLGLPGVQKRYGPPGWVPLAAATLWLAHPVQAETANYIVQRMTILAALFYVLAFFLYIKGRTATNTRCRWGFYGGTLLAALLGLGSKETVAMLPVFLLLFDWYFIRDGAKPLPRKFIPASLALLVIAGLLVFFYLGKNPLAYIANSYHSRDFTLEQRLLTQSRVVLFYLGLVFLPLPSRLNLEHDFPLSTSLLDPAATLFAVALIVLLLVIAGAGAKKHPLLSFCIFWYLGNLLIESSVIGLEIIFQHRLYLPSMLVILPALLWLRRIVRPQWLQAVFFATVMVCLFAWTHERNVIWADTVSLLTDNVKKSPDRQRVHLNLGIELKNSNRIDEAVSHYRKALQIDADYAEAYYNLGNALTIKGDFKGATDNYFAALALTPDDVDTHYNLGYTLAKLWRFDEAVYHYSEAIRRKPDFTKARQELADLRISIQKLQGRKPRQR